MTGEIFSVLKVLLTNRKHKIVRWFRVCAARKAELLLARDTGTSV
jgi:hypothetical protein